MDIRRMLRRWRPIERHDRSRAQKDVLYGPYEVTLPGSVRAGGYQSRPWPVERAVAEAYERIIWVHKAVEAIASNASRLRFQLKQDEDLVEDHPLYRVLNRRANPLETGQQLRKRLVSQILLSKKGAFVEITSSRGGDPLRLDLLPPGRTYPVPGNGDNLIDHYEVLRPDGTRQSIETEKVRWFRDPHPLDAFSGITPLEAAGMSVELDYFSRLYNISFMKNDGRPGGIIGVSGKGDEPMAEGDRTVLRKRFGTGPTEAGKITVVEGQISYADLGAKPREMAYSDTSRAAKIEILSAFGVPESVLGYAAERTFDNADSELYNFWTITMPVILDLLAMGFDDDSSDDLIGGFDTSKIEVLQRAEIARREEARTEFESGLITIDEYREIAGRDPFGMPRTRALWVTTGKTLVATSDADQKKLDDQAAERLPPALAANMAGAGADPGQRRDEPGPAPQQLPRTPTPPARDPEPPRSPQAPTSGKSLPPPPATGTAPLRPVMRLVRPAETKAGVAESTPADADFERLEMQIAAALTATCLRLVARAATRVSSPRLRKGTRHWVPEHAVDTRVGSKVLDGDAAVEPVRWQDETQDAIRPIVAAAAAAAAAALLADLADDDHPQVLLEPVVAAIVGMVGAAALTIAARIRDQVIAADQRGESVEVIAGQIREAADAIPGWAGQMAVQAATAAINGARDAASRQVGRPIDKQWLSRRDAKVRPTHRVADGQVRPVGELFTVGDALLSYPGDPSGPAGETYNCRCRTVHRHRITGQFVATPPGGRTRFTRDDRQAS